MANKPQGSADQAEPSKKTTYTVISPLRHGVLVDGKAETTDYAPGDPVDLTEAEAQPLLGHTVVAGKPAKAAKAPAAD